MIYTSSPGITLTNRPIKKLLNETVRIKTPHKSKRKKTLLSDQKSSIKKNMMLVDSQRRTLKDVTTKSLA